MAALIISGEGLFQIVNKRKRARIKIVNLEGRAEVFLMNF